MKKSYTYNCVCPICGHENKFLDLEETGGLMECESCLNVVQTKNCKKMVNIPVYDIKQVPDLMKKGVLASCT